jgi:CheY-like chemotaxis protein
MGKILLATADMAALDILSAEIGGLGHDVLHAVDGYEAVQAALSDQPDLVFLDIPLAVYNGFETAGMLRADPEIPAELPVFLLTDEDVDVRKREKAGIAGVFPKTHLETDLRELLSRYAAGAP